MKKINNFILCITTITILSFAFYSCSNESEAEIISKDFKSRDFLLIRKKILVFNIMKF